MLKNAFWTQKDAYWTPKRGLRTLSIGGSDRGQTKKEHFVPYAKKSVLFQKPLFLGKANLRLKVYIYIYICIYHKFSFMLSESTLSNFPRPTPQRATAQSGGMMMPPVVYKRRHPMATTFQSCTPLITSPKALKSPVLLLNLQSEQCTSPVQ